jgi:hypothetical protein
MPPPRPLTPRKKSLVLLFEAARRRLARQPGNIAELPNARIVTATADMTRVSEELRRAQPLTEEYGYCSCVASWQWSDGAREATLMLDSRDVGSAEVIHEEEWRAAYRSPAGHRRLCYEASGTMPVMCWEERAESAH